MSIFNRRLVPDGKYSILAVGFPTYRHCLLLYYRNRTRSTLN